MIYEANLFRDPKITFYDPNGFAPHRLRSPDRVNQ